MENRVYKCLLISSFNIDNFAALLTKDKENPALEISIASLFDQVSQVLLDQQNKLWEQNYDFGIIWTQPEKVIKSFVVLLNQKVNIPDDT